jgi:transcriptional regulator with XRE-family HTH domain
MGFAEWLDGELNIRGWSRSEAARRGGVSASMMDKVINGHAQPGMTFYKGIAQAFQMPLKEVLIQAGELDERPAEDSPSFFEWIRIWLSASDEERDRLLERAEQLAKENKEKKGKED